MAGQTKNYNDRLEEFTEERFRKDYNTCKYSSILLFDTRRWLFDISESFIQEHQSCSMRQILTMTRATWSSSLPRWTTIDKFISCFE